MSGRTLGVLLLGFGGLGPDQDHQRDMYLPAFEAHPGFEIVDADLTDPAVDVVSVCAEPDRRVEAVTAALRAGKHVLVDKPLASTAAEAHEIAAAAAAAGRVCLPAHHQRFHPMIGAARGAVAAGTVGLPWNVQADFLVAGGTPSPAGELANFAVYPVDVVLALTGLPVRRVYARIATYWAGPDDFALLLLTHENGLTSTISVGRMRELADTRPAGPAVHRYRISGSHGVLDVDASRPGLDIRRAEGSGRTWHGPGTVDRLLDELHGAVSAGRPSSPSAADAAHVAEIVDAARASAASGDVVDLPDPNQEGSR